jgi:hypothetical protein
MVSTYSEKGCIAIAITIDNFLKILNSLHACCVFKALGESNGEHLKLPYCH